MKRYWIFKGLKFLVFATAFVFLGGYIVMHLWNWLIPSVLSGNIGFAQALGILVLMRILFGGFGRRGHWGGHQNMHLHWKEKMERRMASMTTEEREAFKEKMKAGWGRGCRTWNHVHAEPSINKEEAK